MNTLSRFNYRFSTVDGRIVAMSDNQILEQAA